MRVILTNYVGLTTSGIPIIKAYLKGNQFEFAIDHTTPEFRITADVIINAEKNVLLFDNYTNGELSAIDEYLVRQTFEDYRPHIELYCSNQKCGLSYHMLGQWMRLTKIPSVKGAWSIQPFGLMLEGIRIRNHVVHNDWDNKTTSIYSRNNEDAEPLQFPMVDFSAMDKERLINRIQTLITFS